MKSSRSAVAQIRSMAGLIVGALCLLLASCAEMKPRTGEPLNNRETMGGRGIISGKDGEFVVLRK